MQVLAAWCAVITTAVAHSASAQDKVGAEPKLATKAEYIDCLDSTDAIEAKKSKLSERERKHKELAAKFQAADANLSAQVKRHTPTTKAEIESYNRAVASRNASTASFNIEARGIQQEQASLNRQIVDMNNRCSGLLISEDVAQAAEEQRKRRGSQP